MPRKQHNITALPVATPQEVTLTDEQSNGIKFRLMEIERQKRMTAALELELQHYLKVATGVDVESGQYELDLDKGVLSRVTTA